MTDKEADVTGLGRVRYTPKYARKPHPDVRGRSVLFLMVRFHLGPKMALKLHRAIAQKESPVTHVYNRRQWRRMVKNANEPSPTRRS